MRKFLASAAPLVLMLVVPVSCERDPRDDGGVFNCIQAPCIP